MLSTFKTGNLRGAALRGALLCLLPLLAQFPAALPAGAAINQSFSYQGFLLNKATNLPVETPQSLKFTIYNAATGGAALFSESRCKIGVNKGRYDVEIGSMTEGGIPASVFVSSWGASINQNLWLEIQVAAAGASYACPYTGTYEAMTPRMRLQASPFAFNALYASTASAASPLFSADVIAALPQTAYGAVTISSNLFVMGGISVGSISPGQKLAVAGIVESSTGGFKFPDGSIQIKAAAVTMWEVSGDNVYSINPGNLGVGENLISPLARLHISSAAGDTGDLLLVSTGSYATGISPLFWVNGLGAVHGGSYYGNGGTLNGVVRSTGDVMTGQLTLNGSSLTVTSPFGAAVPKLRLAANVEISSASAANYGGVYISSNVYLKTGAVYYGDGGGLSNLHTYDESKVWKWGPGDTMFGQLTLGFSTNTLKGSTLTVTGSEFSVKGSTFAVSGGSVAIGSLTSFPTKFYVVGDILATSSITAKGGLYSDTLVNALYGNFSNVTASTGTFWGYVGPDPDNSYSINTASGIKVAVGKVVAPYFVGNGSLLDGVLKSTDTSKVNKLGDTMTGSLEVRGSSLTISAYGSQPYALTVGSAAYMGTPYSLTVTTGGYVGVQVNSPAVPLEVRKKARISYTSDLDTDAGLEIYSYFSGYINWKSAIVATDGDGPQQGALGFLPASRTLAYRALGEDPSTNNYASRGAEVFRIDSDKYADWKFGVGTSAPLERFHVGVNVLVSTRTAGYPATLPVLFASTGTGKVSISTTTQNYSLTVGGGVMVGSSVTAQGGFFGDGSGLVNISTVAIPRGIVVASITALAGGTYDAVVFSTAVYVQSKVAIGGLFDPAEDLHVRGTLRLDQQPGQSSVLHFYPYLGAETYIKWDEFGQPANKGVLGMEAGGLDLVYRAGSASMSDTTHGAQAFRIKSDGKVLFGEAAGSFPATERFQVLTNLMVSNSNAGGSILYVSTGFASVGFSTGTPKERVHVASSFLVGADRAAAALFVSTATGFTGIGTGNPLGLLDVNGNILGSGAWSGTASPPVSGAGKRFMWVPSVAAIRAGGVSGTQWDGLGQYSSAFGYDSAALGIYSGVMSGSENTVAGGSSVVGGGEYNYIDGQRSAIPGGYYNVVRSSFAFAGGRNNYLDTSSSGTFVWGYDDTVISGHNNGLNNIFKINTSFAFLIDPADVMHYKAGIRTPAPQAALDVNGDAQFGSGVTKSSFTASGFFVPRAMTTTELHGAAGTPPVVGAVAYNSTIGNICFSTGTAQGGWALAGTKGNCY